jgi:hypothetical protein
LVPASISAERCFAEPWLEALSQARASGAIELRGAMAGTMRQARASNAVARDAHLLRDATRRDAGHVHHERDEGRVGGERLGQLRRAGGWRRR